MKSIAALALAMTFAPVTSKAASGVEGDISSVAPALQRYQQETLDNGLWTRPGLSARDRSVVTVAAVVTRNQVGLMPEQIRRALDNGVKPAELSEIITHLAFYAGWGNAMAAVDAARPIYAERGIGADQLPAANPTLLPLDKEQEARRAASVEQTTGPASPGLVRDTTEVLFGDLWLRPDLAPRDRSLVTVSALISAGQVAQMPFHLNRAMDNGLSREEASEVISHLAYYAGWPNAFSAAPVAREVFEKRANR
jgi:4-carboxymuconolactone decarboxylase